MEIKIENYISQDEIKEIVVEEIKSLLRNDKERERIFSNLAYYLGGSLIKEIIEKEDLEVIRQKSLKLLSDENSIKRMIYNKPDAWQHIPKDDLIVYNEVQNSIKNNIGLVRNNVINELENIDLDNFAEEFDISRLFSLLIKSVKEK